MQEAAGEEAGSPRTAFLRVGGMAAAVHKVALAPHLSKRLQEPAGNELPMQDAKQALDYSSVSEDTCSGSFPVYPGPSLDTQNTSRPAHAQVLYLTDSKTGCQGCHFHGCTGRGPRALI